MEWRSDAFDGFVLSEGSVAEGGLDMSVKGASECGATGFFQVATRDIELGEELLKNYSIANTGRGLVTPAVKRKEEQDQFLLLPDNINSDRECRICKGTLPPANKFDPLVLDIGCKCDSRMRVTCAVKWFSTKIALQLTQHGPDGCIHDNVVNEWTPSAISYCEICRKELTPQFCNKLLTVTSINAYYHPAMKKFASYANSAEGPIPFAIKIAKVPGVAHQVVIQVRGSSCGNRSTHKNTERRRSVQPQPARFEALSVRS